MTSLDQIDYSKHQNVKLLEDTLRDVEKGINQTVQMPNFGGQRAPPQGVAPKQVQAQQLPQNVSNSIKIPTNDTFSVTRPPFSLSEAGLLAVIVAIITIPTIQNWLAELLEKIGGRYAAVFVNATLVPAIYFLALPFYRQWSSH
jgi:hypothetical protein